MSPNPINQTHTPPKSIQIICRANRQKPLLLYLLRFLIPTTPPKDNMAHHTTHRRNLATPDLNPSSNSMDPTLKRQPNQPIMTTTTTKSKHPTTKNPDPTITSKQFYMPNHFSRLNLNHKIHKSSKPTDQQHNPPPGIHIHLQAKAMTVSADLDSSSRFSLIKPNYQPHKTNVPKGEKVSRATKEVSKKDLHKKPSKDLEKKKPQQELVSIKKKQLSMIVNDKEVKDLHEGHDINRHTTSLGRRRSFCGSQVDLADVLASCGVKIVSVDMPPFMQIHAVDCARKTCDSLEKFGSKTLAFILKKEFDGVYGPAWHCFVGTNFGSFVTHSVGGFLYFSMDQKLYILLFKTTVQRAD